MWVTPANSARLFMDRVGMTKSTVLFKFNPAGIILFILGCCIITPFALGTGHCHSNPHNMPPPEEKKTWKISFEDNLKQFIIISFTCQ